MPSATFTLDDPQGLGRSPADMLQLLGPRLAVRLELTPADAARRRAAGLPVPAPIVVQGFLDTGNDGTSVDCTCMAALAAVSVGTREITNYATRQRTACPIYFVRLSFPDLPGFAVDLDDEGVVGGIATDPPDVLGGPVRVLVGRDVLRFCVLTVDGARGVYTLGAMLPPTPELAMPDPQPAVSPPPTSRHPLVAADRRFGTCEANGNGGPHLRRDPRS